MWRGIEGKSYSPDEFAAYCETLQWTAWRPTFGVLHNMGVPNLAQRPDGLTEAHIQGLVHYYRDVEGWSGGPHLFVDDKQIWTFTPLTVRGTHSPSWNAVAFGVEMLGDFETESFSDGRGLSVHQNAISALASIHAALGIEASTLRLHYEDPLTTHKCPGKNVVKASVLTELAALMAQGHEGEHPIDGANPAGGADPQPNTPENA